MDDIIKKIQEYNFHYNVDVSYDYKDSDGLYRDLIVNLKLEYFWFNDKYFEKEIYNEDNIYLSSALSQISSYYNNFYDINDLFEVEIDWGYYGQEIERINLKSDDLILELAVLKYMNDLERVLYSLKISGKDLNQKYNSFDIIQIDPQKIKLSKDEIKNLDQKIINRYYNYKYPICIVNENMEIIDGRHRLYAAIKQKRTKIDVIVLKYEETHNKNEK